MGVPASKSGMYNNHVGTFFPQHPEKFVGTNHSPQYKSSLERATMSALDKSPAVVQWCYEKTVIRYKNPIEGGVHNYYIDFTAIVKDPKGLLHKILIETKSYHETQAPEKPANLLTEKQKANYARACEVYVKNQAKWAAARDFAKQHGYDFIVVTERNLGCLNPY